jgi:hypothetical protein
MRIRKALFDARKSGATSVTLLVEDVERKLKLIQQQDELLAKCMSKLSPEDYQEIFGNLFEDKDKSGNDPSP